MLREQMRQTIEQGMQGFLAGAFAGGFIPLDQWSDYPLTPDSAMVRFVSEYPYALIENTYVEYMKWDESRVLNPIELQGWAAYCWEYARLILLEKLPPAPDYFDDEMDKRRDKWRNEITAQGLVRVK